LNEPKIHYILKEKKLEIQLKKYSLDWIKSFHHPMVWQVELEMWNYGMEEGRLGIYSIPQFFLTPPIVLVMPSFPPWFPK